MVATISKYASAGDALFDAFRPPVTTDPVGTKPTGSVGVWAYEFYKPNLDEIVNHMSISMMGSGAMRCYNNTGGTLSKNGQYYVSGVLNTLIAGDTAVQLSSLVLYGVKRQNSDKYQLFWKLTNTSTTRTFELYKGSQFNTAQLVASGSRSGNGSITITQQNSSGISGSVTVTYTADDTDVSNIITCNLFTLAKADATNTQKFPKVTLDADLTNATAGVAWPHTIITGIDTSAASADGAKIYLDGATPGAITYSSALVNGAALIEVGVVEKKHATEGSIKLYPGACLIVSFGNMKIAGITQISSILSPASIGADQNNYAPTGLSTAGVLRLTSSNNYNITGLSAGVDGQLLYVHNIGAFNLTLKDESASSTAANRFALVSDAALAPDTFIILQYDATSARWRAISGGGSGGAPSGAAGGDLSGTYPNPAVAQASAAFAINGVNSPSSIGSDQNDYNPASLSTAAVLRLTASATVNITGLAGGASGRLLFLHNIGSNTITLKNENASSTAANRFNLISDVTLAAGALAILHYDNTSARWRCLSSSSGGGGSPTGSAGGDLGGTYPNPVVKLASQDFRLTGILSPSSIGADQNDYNPASLSSSSVLRLSASAAYNITGLQGGVDGRIIKIMNVGSFSIVLKDESASSSAANRFALISDITLQPDAYVDLIYDATTARWRADAGTANGTASGDLAGSYPNPTVAQAAAAFALKGILSPASIGSSQNDYNPASLSTASILRLTASASVDITGLQGGADGRFMLIQNIGTNTITLRDESASSSAANRFALISDLSLAPDAALLLVYDNTSARWRVFSYVATGGGGSGDALANWVNVEASLTSVSTLTSSAYGKMHKLSGSSFDTTLPSPASHSGEKIGFRVDQAATGTYGIKQSASEKIDGLVRLDLINCDSIVLESDGTNWQTIFSSRGSRPSPSQKESCAVSVVVNLGIATVNLKNQDGSTDPSPGAPAKFGFRSATLTSGAFNTRSVVAALNGTLGTTQGMGVPTGTKGRIWFGGLDNGGTPEFWFYNSLSGTSIARIYDGQIVTTTTAGTAAQTFTSGTARSSVPIKILGYIEATWTSGTGWTSLTVIQLYEDGMLLPGQSVQRNIYADAGTANGTTQCPGDDTPIQNTEGTQFVGNAAITPTSTINIIRITHIGNYACSANVLVGFGLFQDSVANSIAAGWFVNVAADYAWVQTLDYEMLAGTVSSTTLKVRAGGNAASTIYYNSRSGGRLFAGMLISKTMVEEIMR